ncbi:peptidyl-prolyl cis-trans isomerase [Pseudoalteromonas sp. SMS1]|uniref:peptidylprolyl isomerase n=1 Tax=Pseudoalteromonas sp. SMS1 TaxID=2908894 RepID=UPI001F27850B|nr:peptidylprolyl isomerase [Pseudoalteromonas sp. SMS1]MCF2857846.1 peptidyl-prolyl cis-trans isomerase [Pseudoalteromonas sp. SMS1]
MRCIIFFLAGFVSLPCFAVLNHISKPELDLMYSLYQAQDRDISKKQLKKRLLENQFLISQAQSRALPILKRHSAVGFSNQYHVRRYLLAMLKHKFPHHAKQQMQGITLDWSSDKLISALGPYPNSGQYSDTQLQQWFGVELVKSPRLTLGDVVYDQSMQGRFALHNGDVKQLQVAVNEYVHFHILTKLISSELGKHKLDADRLELLALGELLRPPMQTYLGVIDELHGERSGYVEAIKDSLTTKEIKHFYSSNKQDFKYLDNLLAIALVFADQKQAETIFTQANQSSMKSTMEKNGLYNQFSGSDKLQMPIKITRQHAKSWLAQFAFSSKVGQVSRPIRMPNGQWAIVYTEQPKFKFHAPNSETVRYRASLSLTRKKAATAYEKLFKTWQKTQGVIL